MRRSARSVVVSVAVVALLVAACSAADEAPIVTLTEADVSVVIPSSTPVITLTDPVLTSELSEAGSPTSSTPSSTPAFAETAPLPAGLDAAQQQTAVAAMDAYSSLWQLIDASQSAPNQDWAAQIAEVASPAYATGQLEYLRTLVTNDRHQTGSTDLVITTMTVSADTVTLQGCVGGDVKIVGADGSIVYDLTSGGAIQTALVRAQSDGSWKVDEFKNPSEVLPC